MDEPIIVEGVDDFGEVEKDANLDAPELRDLFADNVKKPVVDVNGSDATDSPDATSDGESDDDWGSE